MQVVAFVKRVVVIDVIQTVDCKPTAARVDQWRKIDVARNEARQRTNGIGVRRANVLDLVRRNAKEKHSGRRNNNSKRTLELKWFFFLKVLH